MPRKMRPYWSFYVTRRDIPGILFGAVVVALVVYLLLTYPGPFTKHINGTVFGPDWTCQSVPNSDSICVKDVPRRPAP